MLKNILIVGAGGIGSWLAHNLNHLSLNDQLNNAQFTIADDDEVEIKNLSYQYYNEDHLFEPKVQALHSQFPFFDPLKGRITQAEQFENYDLVVSAVDNTVFRKLMFETLISQEKDWLDARAEGRACSLMGSHASNTLEKMLQTIPVEKEDQSCQRAFELENNIVQTGNRIIAAITAQNILNWVRGDKLIKQLILQI